MSVELSGASMSTANRVKVCFYYNTTPVFVLLPSKIHVNTSSFNLWLIVISRFSEYRVYNFLSIDITSLNVIIYCVCFALWFTPLIMC